MTNEMRLRIDFLELYLSNIVRKKCWTDIRDFRDLFICINRMLQVLLEHKLGKQYPSFKPKKFGLCPVAQSLLFEASHASFVLYTMCPDLNDTYLSLLYRICCYVLPKIRLISLPDASLEHDLLNCIYMQNV